MTTYAHKDQVTSALNVTRARLVAILDTPAIPEGVYDAVMVHLEAIADLISWSDEEEIVDAYCERLPDPDFV